MVVLESLGASLSDITVSAHHNLFTGNEHISGSEHSVDDGLSASVHVIELGLGDGVIDVDGNERKELLLGQVVKSVDTSGGFLGNSLDIFAESSESFWILRDHFSEESVKSLFVLGFDIVWVW